MNRQAPAQWQQRLQEQEQRLQEALKMYQRAEKVNEQLLAQIRELERLAIVGQLAAGIVHDFNNVMAVILLLAQLLSRTVTLPSAARRHLKTIEQQAERASDLIQQILGFCRHPLRDHKELDLKLFLKELVDLLSRTLPDNIQVELVQGQDEYIIHASPSCIQQVIMNLAVNARDSLSNGGKLLVGLARLYLAADHIPGMPSGVWLQITVQDNGVGISPDILPHIFEPFFTTKEANKGTGLGLTQVYSIMQQHDGYIAVQSEPDQGTTFHLYFPAFTSADPESLVLPDSNLKSGLGQLVLVVEDNPDTRSALLASLELLNYRVLAAANGCEALSLLLQGEKQIDLVLSDVVMPEMGGVALLHAMRHAGLTTPVLFLTGHPMGEEIEELRKQGLAGWLPKPPDLERLAALLAQTI